MGSRGRTEPGLQPDCLGGLAPLPRTPPRSPMPSPSPSSVGLVWAKLPQAPVA